MPRTLVIRTHNGLGNRLRAVVTGVEWARLADREVRVAWPTGRRFGAALGDLFETDLPTVSDVRSRVVAALTRGARTIHTLRSDDPRPTLVVFASDPFVLDDGTQISEGPLLRRLVPTPAVVERMRSIDAWNRPVVGVMIRAHPLAHPETRRASPPEWFYERMAQLRSTDPDVRFFLSTDSPEVSRQVHARFDGVYELADKGGFNTRRGLVDAVADLYLLAGTTYILGSHWSSFTGTAWHLAGHGGFESSRRRGGESWEQRRTIVTSPRLSG